MKTSCIILTLFFFSLPGYSQVPDTLIIKTVRMKGYGPFSHSVSIAKTMDSANPWIKTVPTIKGIPDNLTDLMFCTYQADFLQNTYQSYFAGKLSGESYNSFKNAGNWEPDSTEFTKKEVKCSIPIAAGYEEHGRIKVILDRNNNYDFSDDEYYIIPDTIKGQSFWDRYNDSLLIECAYEYYDGHNIRKGLTWIYIDFSPDMLRSSLTASPITLAINVAEYFLGQFILDNKIYSIALRADGRAVFREQYIILLGEAEKGIAKGELFNKNATEKDQLIKIGKYDYRFVKASLDGSIITLIKENLLSGKEGRQKGLKAFNFSGKTIDGKDISLKDFRGKYVLLDFWGTWCHACQEEIKTLKRITKLHDSNLIVLGIAKDKPEVLKDYIEKKKIDWPQILQNEDTSILKLYKITVYPTTYLIDPEGKIIEINLRGKELEDKLDDIFEGQQKIKF